MSEAAKKIGEMLKNLDDDIYFDQQGRIIIKDDRISAAIRDGLGRAGQQMRDGTNYICPTNAYCPKAFDEASDVKTDAKS